MITNPDDEYSVEEDRYSNAIIVRYIGEEFARIIDSVEGIIVKEGWVIQAKEVINHEIDTWLVIGVQITCIPLQSRSQVN